MHRRRTPRPNAGEEVEPLQTDEAVLMLATVASEEDGSRARSVADPEDVAFLERRAVRVRRERVVVRPEAVRAVRDRVPVES